MMALNRVPFADLKLQTQELQSEIDSAIAAVMSHGQFIKGPEVAVFEKAFAAYCEADFCIGASNGTSALHAALHSAGIHGDHEVIIPAHTFMATVESVRQCGAKPIFADIDAASMLIDPASVESKVTPRTRAIVPVHLYGCPVEMDRLNAIAERFGLIVIEDAAQAHGARWKGRRIGSIGTAATFSFFPSKNLGAFGDAGGVTTNDNALAERCARYVDHGRDSKYTHAEDGTNYRLDTLQAAVLLTKLLKLDQWNDARQRIAARYIEILSQEPFTSAEVRWQVPPDGAEPVYHLFVVRVPYRDQVITNLTKLGIGTGIHYPVPCHVQRAARDLECPAGSLPVTERVANEIISLPMYPHMTMDQVEIVCEALKESIHAGASA